MKCEECGGSGRVSTPCGDFYRDCPACAEQATSSAEVGHTMRVMFIDEGEESSPIYPVSVDPEQGVEVFLKPFIGKAVYMTLSLTRSVSPTVRPSDEELDRTSLCELINERDAYRRALQMIRSFGCHNCEETAAEAIAQYATSDRVQK